METIEKKDFNQELKEQWKNMWRSRLDDKLRAEGIADKDYTLLFIERGTVIMATRKFKSLDLYEIMQQHRLAKVGVTIPPLPSIGGWRKFAKDSFNHTNSRKRRRSITTNSEKPDGQQLKKNGRGWLHSSQKIK